jgi:predicted O-methyltransferase YrrM
MLTLEELGQKHECDKFFHKFLGHYSARFGHLRHEPITLLEIGTWKGYGVRMFREFFDHPDAKIVGIDHNPEWTPGPDDRITIEIGKQEDIAFQDDFGKRHGPFDVVIDDGGHQPHQHLASLQALWPHVKPGGWLVADDYDFPQVCKAIEELRAAGWDVAIVAGVKLHPNRRVPVKTSTAFCRKPKERNG